MNPLPATASVPSRLRYQVARELTDSQPEELGQAAALSGSAARGLADDYSDIELRMWVDELPRREQWWKWLQSVGAADVSADTTDSEEDGTVWIGCRFRGIWAEIGWTRIADFESFLERVLRLELIDHRSLALASAVLESIPLRGEERLHQWSQRLESYPEGLRDRIIGDSVKAWSDPQVPAVRWALASRQDYFALTMRLVWDIERVLRILFALNEQWEPDWKWIKESSHELRMKPERLAERLDDAFTLPEPTERIAAVQHLVLDTLEMVPPPNDVSLTRAAISQALNENQS